MAIQIHMGKECTQGPEQENASLCYCGHDCARCMTYLATVNDDGAMRERARRFYEETFARSLSPEELVCYGGRSSRVCVLCKDCPFARCCRERGIASCRECPQYPCAEIAAYEAQYVNQCGQISDSTETEQYQNEKNTHAKGEYQV